MSADVVQFPGNFNGRAGARDTGALEAVATALTRIKRGQPEGLSRTDHFLTELWCLGFKVVPLKGDE